MATNKPKARGKVKPSPVADPAPPVPLLNEYAAQHLRHWNKAKPNGQDRDIASRFLELERDGIVSLYSLAFDLAREIYSPAHHLFHAHQYGPVRSWSGIGQESGIYRDACARNDGKDPKEATPYGDTYTRAKDQLVCAVYESHTLTPEEIETHNAREREEERPGMPGHYVKAGHVEPRPRPDLSKNATAEEVGNGWVALFVAEVVALLGSDPDADHVAGLVALHRNIAAHRIGATEGAETRARLESESKGREVLAAFDRCRSRLLRLLGELVEEYRPTAEETGQTFKWLGTPGELCALFQTLVEKKWIPEQRGKVARFMAAVFVTSNGEPFNAGTLETWLKRSNAPPVRTDVDFTATENPEKV